MTQPPLDVYVGALFAGLLVAISVVVTRASARWGVPTLALFLGVGMLAGSDGLGGIWFDDYRFVWTAGSLLLGLLLFSGGLDTDTQRARGVLAPGVALATVGVAVTSVLTAAFQVWVLESSWQRGFLLGSIVASTDAAAVFGVLRAADVRLRGRLRELLELESGSNDPIAIFLTLTATAIALGAAPSPGGVLAELGMQAGIGGVVGVLGGLASVWALNHLRVRHVALYAIFALSGAAMVFGGSAVLGGSAFLAVYVAGLVLAAKAVVHRRSIVRFHDSLAWLAQIALFVMLGLLVFPSKLPSVWADGLATTAFLVFVARPVAVALSLTPFRVPWREQALVAWVGLRGAGPIVLATWPSVAGVPGASELFGEVFFVVASSVLLQGTSLPWVARRLGLEAPPEASLDGLAGESAAGARALDLELPPRLDETRVMDLGLPRGGVIVTFERDGEVRVPSGATALRAGDRLRVIVQTDQEDVVRARLQP